MIINNLPGADGKIGWTRLVKSKPNGYTIGYINLPTFTTLANEKNASFKITQIDPIANHHDSQQSGSATTQDSGTSSLLMGRNLPG